MSDLFDEPSIVVPLAPTLAEVPIEPRVVGNGAVTDNEMPIVNMLDIMKFSNNLTIVSQATFQPEAMLTDTLCTTSPNTASSPSYASVDGEGTGNCTVRPLDSSSAAGQTSANATLVGGGLIVPNLDAEIIDYSEKKRYVKAKVNGGGPLGTNATGVHFSAFPSVSGMLKHESTISTAPVFRGSMAAAVECPIDSPPKPTNEPRSSTMIPVRKVDIPVYLHNSEYYRALQAEEEDEVILIPSDCMKFDDTVTNDADLRSLLLTLRFWVAGSIFDSIIEYTRNYPLRSTEYTLSEFYPDFPALKHFTSLDQTKLPMAAAIESGDLEFVKYLLKRGHTWPKKACDLAVQTGHVDMLTFALHAGCAAFSHTCVLAAARGHLGCLRVLHEHGVEWDNTTLTVAAEKGHLNCLQYAHEQGLCLTGNLYALAVASHNFAMVKYLHVNGCAWVDTKACEAAAASGNMDILKFLHENGCPWDVTVCQKAAEKRQLTIVLYLLRNGCPPSNNIWDFTSAAFHLILGCFLEVKLPWSATPSAMQHVYDASCGDVLCLQQMHENGCPWSLTTRNTDVKLRPLDAVLYMLRHGCVPFDNIWDFTGHDFHRILECFLEAGLPWSTTPDAMLLVIKSNNLEGLKCLVESGCPWHPTTTARIVYYAKNMEMLEYAHAQGCPWSENTCALAKSMEFLTFAHTHGAPIKSDTCALLLKASPFSLECFKYAHKHGSCLTSACINFAMRRGDNELQNYLREHNCPKSSHPVLTASDDSTRRRGPPTRRILTVKKKVA